MLHKNPEPPTSTALPVRIVEHQFSLTAQGALALMQFAEQRGWHKEPITLYRTILNPPGPDRLAWIVISLETPTHAVASALNASEFSTNEPLALVHDFEQAEHLAAASRGAA